MALLGVLALTAAAPATPVGREPLDVASAAVNVRELANFYGPPQFAISSDGRTIAYVEATPTDRGDAYSIALWVGDKAPEGKRRLLVKLPDSPSTAVSASPRFSPDGQSLAYLSQGEVQLVDLATGAQRSLTKDRLPAGATPISFSWAPDGSAMALLLAMPPDEVPDGGMETTTDWPMGGPGPASRLALLDMKSGTADLLSDPSIDVMSMSWAPDGKRLALGAAPVESNDRYYDQDIYIIDRSSRSVTLAARLEGLDSEPAWSPDGRWIAFASQAGEGSKDWLQLLGLIDVESGAISFPARAEFEEGLSTPRHFAWGTGGRLYFTSAHHLHAPIFELSLPGARLRRFSPLDRSYLSGLIASPDHRSLLFGRETVDRPRDLYMSPVGRFEQRRLTSFNPQLALPAHNLRLLSWKSPDGRWDIDGVLIAPEGPSGPRPLITLVEGGPSMVRLQFELGQQQRVFALVAGGYAVFLPNTRGRPGYSKAFRRAIPDNKDYVAGGYSDLMAGIDKLVSEGVADPDRLGISGFSYGAVLTAYTIGQTRRFAAASINEAPVDWRYSMSLGAANPAMQAQWRDQVGYGDPYDPADLALMTDQSPIHHVSKVETPTLLEYGVKEYGGLDEMGGGQLFQALRRFRIPSELIRYPRTGHGINEPRLRLESARRNLEWFDYWLLGRATPRMTRTYGPSPVKRQPPEGSTRD